MMGKERTQRPLAQQAEVGMVIDRLAAHRGHEAVECLRRPAFEHAVRGTTCPHAIDHIGSFGIVLHHASNDIHIVLQVGINGDNGFGLIGHMLHSRPQSLLMTHIMRQANASYFGIFTAQAFYQRPCAVAAAVVHIENACRTHKGLDDICQLTRGFGQYGFFVIAGDNDVNHWIWYLRVRR